MPELVPRQKRSDWRLSLGNSVLQLGEILARMGAKR